MVQWNRIGVAAAASLWMLAVGCGPGSSPDSDAGVDSDAASDAGDVGFERTERYPGACRGLVLRGRDRGVDAVERMRYEGATLKYRTFDGNADGEIGRRTTYGYDDQGRLFRRDLDEGPDGVIDKTRWYDYDRRGRRSRELMDRDGDGEVELTISFDHDDEGRRVVGTGRSRDGDLERRIEYDWTEEGWLDALRIDGLRGRVDGRPDRLVEYLYDTYGNLVEGRFDYDGDTVADVVVFYRYDCWRSGNPLTADATG